MTHPKFGIKKKYIAKVKGIPDRESLRKLEHGNDLEDWQNRSCACENAISR